MNITLTITSCQIADMMVSAIEGNSMTRAWCHGVYWRTDADAPPSGPGPWYDDPALFADEPNLQIEVHEIIDESLEPEGANIAKHVCRAEQFFAGITLMAEQQTSHFADWISGSGDNVTADVFLQCVALKEVRYG